MNSPNHRTTSKAEDRTDRAIRIWIVIHGLIVLGWFVFWANFQRLYHLGENPEDQTLLPLLIPTGFAFPAMMLIDLAILIIFAMRKERLLLLFWLLDFLLILAQMKFMLPLVE
jgi:hypothetical protein